MKCKCGYDFVPRGERNYSSFVVISDEDYQEFLRAETATLECTDPDAKLDAIAHASTYVGSALQCPDCNRLTLVLPGGVGKLFYALEEQGD